MKLLAFPRRLPILTTIRLLAILCGAWPAARLCASPTNASAQRCAARPGASYRIFWTATRAADNAPLLAVSAPAEQNKTSAVRTNSTTPEENKPALPLLTASFSPLAGRAGVFELKVLASVHEVARNKKGKLKRSKRNIGALVPTRLGENQVVNAEGDPIRLEVRLESAR